MTLITIDLNCLAFELWSHSSSELRYICLQFLPLHVYGRAHFLPFKRETGVGDAAQRTKHFSKGRKLNVQNQPETGRGNKYVTPEQLWETEMEESSELASQDDLAYKYALLVFS